MASLTNQVKWVTATTDAAAVMRALAPIMVRGTRSLPGTVASYAVATTGMKLADQENLSDALARLPAAPSFLEFRAHPKLTLYSMLRHPSFYIELSVGEEYSVGRPSETTRVKLRVQGPDTDQTHGLFLQAQSRIAAEIERQDAAEWSATPLDTGPIHLASKADSSNGKSRLRTLAGSGWSITIGGTVIAGVILAYLLGWLNLPADGTQTTPPSSPAATTTPSTTTPPQTSLLPGDLTIPEHIPPSDPTTTPPRITPGDLGEIGQGMEQGGSGVTQGG